MDFFEKVTTMFRKSRLYKLLTHYLLVCSMAVEIIFEAHGTTFDNEAHLSSGWNDVELSPLGVRQSREMGERYKDIHFDAIFCSDLQRAYKSGELAFGDKFPIIQDARLRECDYGDFTQHPSSEVDVQKPKCIKEPFLNGESYEQTSKRMGEFLADLSRNYDGKRVMIIGHRATQYGLEHWIKELPLEMVIPAPWKWQPGWNYVLSADFAYETTFATWNTVARLYQERFMDLDLYDDTYDTFCQLVDTPKAKVLEIGCGPGNITRYLLVKRPDFEILGIDVAPEMVALAKSNLPTARFEVMDCRKMDWLVWPFDAIVCGFCMPYISPTDCKKLFRDCSDVLKNGGVLYFSVIEGDPERSGFQSGSNGKSSYLYFYREEFLRSLLDECGFIVASISRKHYWEARESSPEHLIIIARKV